MGFDILGRGYSALNHGQKAMVEMYRLAASTNKAEKVNNLESSC